MSLTLFSAKGGPLTNAEVDGNFTYLEGRNNATDAAKLDKTAVGQSVAPLVAGKVPLGNLPDSVVSGLSYKGTWNAATNTPNLTTVQPSGSYYIVAVAGTFGGTPYAVGDWIISNGTAWQKFEPVEDAATVAKRVLSEATLRLNFADNDYRVYGGLSAGLQDKAFTDALTYTRGSVATGETATGTLATVTTDQPRLVWNSGKPEGLLIEGQATNLLLWSEDFSNAAWTKSSSSVTAGSSIAPDGTLTADLVVELAESAPHNANQLVGGTTQGQTYTITTFVKFAGRRYLVIDMSDTVTGGTFVYVDLATGTFSQNVVAGGNWSEGKAAISSVADGWYRVSVSAKLGSATDVAVYYWLSDSPTGGEVPSYMGDGTSGVYIWGAQLEVGSQATSYIKTEGTQVTRQADAFSRTFGAEYGPTEATFYWEATPLTTSPSGNSGNLHIDSNGPDEITSVVNINSKFFRLTVTPAVGAEDGFLDFSYTETINFGDRLKYALTKDASNVFRLYVNGKFRGQKQAASNLAIYGIKQINNNSGVLAGIAVFPKKLTEAELIALTTL